MLPVPKDICDAIIAHNPRFKCAISGNIMHNPAYLTTMDGRRIYLDRDNLEQYLRVTQTTVEQLSTADCRINPAIPLQQDPELRAEIIRAARVIAPEQVAIAEAEQQLEARDRQRNFRDIIIIGAQQPPILHARENAQAIREADVPYAEHAAQPNARQNWGLGFRLGRG